MTFGNWPDEIHEDIEQKKRLTSAMSAKLTPLRIDADSQSGVFAGSAATPYTTTLDSCTCVDFIRRKLPCKHIYRLAIELGLVHESAKSWKNREALNYSQMSLSDAVAELENLPDDCQIFILELLQIEHTEFVVAENDKDILSCSFLTQEALDIQRVMGRMSKKEIMDTLIANGYAPEKSLKKDDLITWCAGNVPDAASLFQGVIYLSISPYAKKIRRKLLDYLRRKYGWTKSYSETESNGISEFLIPDGTEAAKYVIDDEQKRQKLYYFPNDEITELLNLYGFNRCQNGFSPQRIDRNGVFDGKKIAITGSFADMTRADISKEILIRGGRVTEFVTKNIDYLVEGRYPGVKLQKAMAKSVQILDEQGFLALLDKN